VLRSHKPLKYYVLLIRIVNNITYSFWWFFCSTLLYFSTDCNLANVLNFILKNHIWEIFDRTSQMPTFLKFKALSTTNQRKCMRASSQYRFLLSNLKRKNRAKFSFLFFYQNLISKIYYASYWVTYLNVLKKLIENLQIKFRVFNLLSFTWQQKTELIIWAKKYLMT
jgi:hypothetical protein